MIIPVPLGKHRLKERDYNQVAMIAMSLAMALSVEYAPGELTRNKETPSQVELTKQKRKENAKGAVSGWRGSEGEKCTSWKMSQQQDQLYRPAQKRYICQAQKMFTLSLSPVRCPIMVYRTPERFVRSFSSQ